MSTDRELDFSRDPMWVFVWAAGRPRPFPTSIASYRRNDCIKKVEREIGWTWRQIYRRGGRCMLCTVVPVPVRAAAALAGES